MRYVLLLLLGSLLGTSAWAQSKNQVAFRVLSESGEVDSIYYDLKRSEPTELKASDYVRSAFYEARVGEPMEIYRLLPAEDGEGELRREVVGRITWPTAGGPFLLLVSKRGENYAFSVAADGFERFPFGSFRVVNASSRIVLIKVGDTMARLVPEASKVLQPDLDKEIRGVLFQVAAKVDEPKLVYSNLWNGSKTTRTLVFILDRDHPVTPIGVKRLHESEALFKARAGAEEDGDQSSR